MKHFVKTILAQSKSRIDFYRRLEDIGLPIYTSQQGYAIGVKDGDRKYTFKKLGISPDDFYRLDRKAELIKIKNRLARLELIRKRQQERQNNLEL